MSEAPSPQQSRSRPASSHSRDAAPIPLKDRLVDGLAGLVFGILLRVPYERRIAATGWLMRRVIGPLSSMPRRIRSNLAHVFPDMTRDEVDRLCREVPDNFGRSVVEMFSGAEFVRRSAAMPIEGPGYAAMTEARDAGRPMVLVTGHIGNYDVARAAFLSRGFRVGALYRPMKNRAFNDRYLAAMGTTGEPLFPRSRAGMASMVRFLRGGGALALVIDQYVRSDQVVIDFLGKPAQTSLAAAELALKYDALMVPAYAIRQPDGLSFRIRVEAPIPHGDPQVMTQAFNDSLAAQIRANMGQWLWTYPRWRHR